MSLRFAYGLLFTLASSAWASPPVDLAGERENKLPRERPLTQDDLVYTDNIKSDETQLQKESGAILFEVTGRKRPVRSGAPVHDFHPGDLVRKLRVSKDQKWFGVETVHGVKGRGRVRAWLPATAVKWPEAKAAEASAKEKEAGGGAAATDPFGGAPAPEGTNEPKF